MNTRPAITPADPRDAEARGWTLIRSGTLKLHAMARGELRTSWYYDERQAAGAALWMDDTAEAVLGERDRRVERLKTYFEVTT